MGHSSCFSKTASDRLEEGEDDVKSARPLWAGLHAYYNDNYNKMQKCELERIFKSYLSSDCCLQLDSMKMESLVIADQHAAVNSYLSLVHTACHATEINLTGRLKKNKDFLQDILFEFKIQFICLIVL